MADCRSAVTCRFEGLPDVHPAAVEEVVGDLPAAETQGDDLRALPGDDEEATAHASWRRPAWPAPPGPCLEHPEAAGRGRTRWRRRSR